MLIDNWLLVEDGELSEAETLALLTGAEYPSRNPQTNLADLRAQIAANEKGAEELRRMVGQYGLDVVRGLHGRTSRRTPRRRSGTSSPRCSDGAFTLRDWTTARGSGCEVTVDHESRTATIDFTGTSARSWRTTSTPRRAWRMAAVLYVFRTLVDKDIPLNAGCLQPLNGDHPAGDDAVARVPGRGRRGQRRDQPGGHRRPVRRARTSWPRARAR